MMKVSVVTPFFRPEKAAFARQILSLCNQTLRDIELIYVDCEGGDEARALLAQKQAADPRINIIEGAQSAGEARELGLLNASGQYVGFMDEGDYVDEDFYEKLYARATRDGHEIDIVKARTAFSEPEEELNDLIAEGLKAGNLLPFLFTTQHTSAIYRRLMLTENGVCGGAPEDAAFLLRATAYCRAFVMIGDAFYHRGEISGEERRASLLERTRALCERLPELYERFEGDDPRLAAYLRAQTEALIAEGRTCAQAERHSIERISAPPFVSVISPVFNGELVLPDFFACMHGQTLRDFEMIFVDDGSTDGTRALIEEYMRKDSRVQYYYQENSGAGVARNLGIAHAKGQYVIALDVDDLYDDDLLETIYGEAVRRNADVVVSQFRHHDEWRDAWRENVGYPEKYYPEDRVYSPKDPKVSNFIRNLHPGPCNKLVRREMIVRNKIYFSSTRVANDILYAFAVMGLAKRVYFVRKNLSTVRRYHLATSISSNRLAHLQDSIIAVRETARFFREREELRYFMPQVTLLAGGAIAYNSQYGYNEEFLEQIRIMFTEPPWSELKEDERDALLNVRRDKRRRLQLEKARAEAESAGGQNEALNVNVKMLENLIDNYDRIYQMLGVQTATAK